MNEENNTGSESGITTPLGSLNFKGKKAAEFISIVLLALFAVLAYAFWEHKTDQKAADTNITAAMKDNASATRLMACLISLPQDERKREFTQDSSFCKQMSRLQ